MVLACDDVGEESPIEPLLDEDLEVLEPGARAATGVRELRDGDPVLAGARDARTEAVATEAAPDLQLVAAPAGRRVDVDHVGAERLAVERLERGLRRVARDDQMTTVRDQRGRGTVEATFAVDCSPLNWLS